LPRRAGDQGALGDLQLAGSISDSLGAPLPG